MSLITLVYLSVATQYMTDDDLRAILETSRRNNQACQITGMLLYRDRYFIQALEGEQETVETLYETIKADPRHTNSVLIYKQPISQRSFGNWSMGFNKLTDLDDEQLSGYTDFLQLPLDQSPLIQEPNRARSLLALFKDRSIF